MRTLTIGAVVLGLTSYTTADQQQRHAMVAGATAFHASLAMICDKPGAVCSAIASTTQAAWRVANDTMNQTRTDDFGKRADNLWRTQQ